MAHKIMIATLYSYEPIIAGVMKLGASELYLLVDENPDKKQKDALAIIKNRLADFVEIKEVKTNVYDILLVGKACVDLIDKISPTSKIILNISAARKTKALGLLFSGYSRFDRIEKIVYITKENKEIIELPKLRFTLSNKQRKILGFLEKNPNSNIYDLMKAISCSRANVYRQLTQLKEFGYVTDNLYKVSDAGKFALL